MHFEFQNTTQRIHATGGDWRGAHGFTATLNANNPRCCEHWHICVTNNPGGCAPKLNQTEWDELVDRLADEQRAEHAV